MAALVQPSSAPQKMGPSSTLIALVIIVAVVVVVGIIALVMLVSSIPDSPIHDLRADLTFYPENSWLGVGSSGVIEVWGDVYNYGSSDCLGTLHLRIFDGYSWHDYSELLGRIPGDGGHVYFEKTYSFDPMNEDTADVRYWLTGD